jgi:serine/threonine protein kinase
MRSSSRNCGRHHGRMQSGESIISNDVCTVAALPLSFPIIRTEAPSSDRTVRTVSTEGTPYKEVAMDLEQKPFNEAQARIWFLQLLEGLRHLQKKGVCHRNIHISNILIESRESNNLVLIDFTSAIRVPYKDDSNLGGVADVSQGTHRLLIHNENSLKPHGAVARTESRSRNARLHRAGESLQYRKQFAPAKSSVCSSYSFPELVEGELYDGFTVDLWFDNRYRQVHLRDLIVSTRTTVSNEVIDLMQNMLWYDPRRRLSLNEVFLHPWIAGTVHPSPPPAMTEEITEGMAAVFPSTPPRWYSARRFHSSFGSSGAKERTDYE